MPRDITAARCAAAALTVFRPVLDDPIARAFLTLLSALTAQTPLAPDIDPLEAYCRLFALLAEDMEFYRGAPIGDAWQNHLLDILLADENAFSRKCELGSVEEMGTSLLAAVGRDLAALEDLFRLPAHQIAEETETVSGVSVGSLPWWDQFRPLSQDLAAQNDESWRLKTTFLQTHGWPTLLDQLAKHYRDAGAGLFAHHRAFRWIQRDGAGRIEGISSPDPIQLDSLIGYEDERAILIENTEHFVAGLPANNVLLYGDRGTGKSSTVKALLNAYHRHGLRLIEVSKQHLCDYPRIASLLRGRGEKFILFVDDLSFEDDETHYKEMKAALEGGIEERPANVLVYATSNRRHLIRERFSDRRESPDDEVHGMDTLEEKLSLGDRFGITVTFFAPDQERYLAIVEGLASQRGLDLPAATLHQRALQWAAQHNGRSGRTARQFIDYLQASTTALATTQVAPLHQCGIPAKRDVNTKLVMP